MHIAPGQGLTTPWERNLNVNRNILSLRSFVASFKKNSLKSDFIPFFPPYFIHLYSRRSGANNPRGQYFDVNRNLYSLCSFDESFKTISLKSDFIQFFHDFIRVYSPGAGPDNPLGTKF